ncbi:MAG: EAL domain-containing protein [Prochlorothrix sp.]|nr:EAL domain-containing protein [Prochlorothrix sp.]
MSSTLHSQSSSHPHLALVRPSGLPLPEDISPTDGLLPPSAWDRADRSESIPQFQRSKFVADMALAIAEANTPDEALSLILQQTCQFTGWHYGEVWLPRLQPQHPPQLICSPLWYCHDPETWTAFRSTSLKTTFTFGEGLPGRVWQSQAPEWIPNVDLNSNAVFRRADLARQMRLQAGLGVPILGQGEVLAVLAFFMLDQHQEDHELVDLISTLAIHIGGVVQRKRMEVAIQASEARLQALFTSLPGFVFQKLPEAPWTMQYLSAGCQDLLGYGPEVLTHELESPRYEDLIRAEDWPRIQAQMQQAVSGQSCCYVVEYRVQTQNGEERWLWEKGCGRYSRQGKLVSLEGFITDVTDRKQAEHKFQNQQALLQLVLDTIPQAVFWKDKDLRYLGGNQRWLQDLGLPNVERVVGKTDFDFQAPERAVQYQAYDRCIIESEAPSLHQIRAFQTEDGTLTYKDISKVPIHDANQQLVGVLGTYEDITERRRAEMDLAQRERYMAAIVAIQTLLLDSSHSQVAHGPILQALGEVSEADRLYWVEASLDPDSNQEPSRGVWLMRPGHSVPTLFQTRLQAQWVQPHLTPGTTAAPLRDRQAISDWRLLQPQICCLAQGQVINCSITALRGPGRSFLQQQGVKAVLMLPLIAQRKFFGFLGFERYRNLTPWSEVEVQMLQSATLSIALMQEHHLTLSDLAKTESKYRSIFENAVEGIFQSTPEGKYRTVNPMLARIYGYDSPEELVREIQNVGEQLYVNPQDRALFVKIMEQDGLVRGFEAQVRRKDGRIIWIAEYARAIYGKDGEIVSYEGTVQDITDRKRAEANLCNRDRLLQGLATANHCLLSNPEMKVAMPLVLQTLGEATDADRVYLYQNHPHHSSGVIAMSMRYEWCAPGIAPSINQPHWQNLPYHAHGLTRWYQNFSMGKCIQGRVTDFPPQEQELLARDHILSIVMVPVVVDEHLWGYIGFDDCQGNKSWAAGEVTLLTTMAASLGAALKRQKTEQAMEYQAFHDDLTGLPNRVYFNQSLPLALKAAEAAQESLAVMFLDLDRFKTINDSLGHVVGDRLLQQATARLLSVLHKSDTIARWGGDEFTLYLPHIRSAEEVAEVCRRLLEVLRPTILIDGHSLHVSASIGVALYPQDGTSAATLLSHADIAMYRVKEQGRNHYQFYQGATNPEVSLELILEQDLYQALPRQEFYLCYQPRVDAKTGSIMQMEALLRWNHPLFGLISPTTFIKIAETNGLMVPIGEWVLRSACAQAREWQRLGFPVGVAVNLSPRQFRNKTLVQTIRQVLTQTQLEPVYLELEVTETIAMADTDFSIQILEELRRMGVRLALDDFGTGYSSLNRLKQFPLDTLKIDQSFVRGLPDDAQDWAIVSTIVALGQGLGLEVVAEGVETPEQLACLQHLGCTEVQGYLLSAGLPVEEATDLLQRCQGQLDVSATSDWIVGQGQEPMPQETLLKLSSPSVL